MTPQIPGLLFFICYCVYKYINTTWPRQFWIPRASLSTQEPYSRDKSIVQVLLILAARDFCSYFWAPESPGYHWPSSKSCNSQQLVPPSWLPSCTVNHTSWMQRGLYLGLNLALPFAVSVIIGKFSKVLNTIPALNPSQQLSVSLWGNTGGNTESTSIGWAHW